MLADISSVTITEVDQLSEYTEADSMEFILGANITVSAYQMSGAHLQWTDETPRTHTLTFSGLQSVGNGGALYIPDKLTMLKGVEFSGNSAQSGGAICGYARSGVSISGNGTVSFSGNTAANYGGGFLDPEKTKTACGLIELLVDLGADPNINVLHGNTPLHMAAGVYHEGIVEFSLFGALMDCGADWNIKNDKGETPRDCVRENLLSP